jgi:hypothetical protein
LKTANSQRRRGTQYKVPYLLDPGVAERIRRAHATLGVVHKALLQKVDEISIGALQQLRNVLDLRAALLVMGVLWQWVALGICECYNLLMSQ